MKISKGMDKYTIALNQFNSGYDEGYKKLLKEGIQSISSPTPRNFRSVIKKEVKAVAKLQEVKTRGPSSVHYVCREPRYS